METIKISVIKDKQTYDFEVHDYAHHDGDKCKFEIFDDGKMVAAFEPDNHEYLRICKNPGKLDEEVLHLIADKLEAMNL
ncbi:MAG: hypothetical protein EOP46_14635 [Sphingobacteriaceae bacterium]|nr:MAG: hypothetical protein EOP46_14635 [Sphingobacteriaceae bacterium]